jgi:hypothetical protein
MGPLDRRLGKSSRTWALNRIKPAPPARRPWGAFTPAFVAVTMVIRLHLDWPPAGGRPCRVHASAPHGPHFHTPPPGHSTPTMMTALVVLLAAWACLGRVDARELQQDWWRVGRAVATGGLSETIPATVAVTSRAVVAPLARSLPPPTESTVGCPGCSSQ